MRQSLVERQETLGEVVVFFKSRCCGSFASRLSSKSRRRALVATLTDIFNKATHDNGDQMGNFMPSFVLSVSDLRRTALVTDNYFANVRLEHWGFVAIAQHGKMVQSKCTKQIYHSLLPPPSFSRNYLDYLSILRNSRLLIKQKTDTSLKERRLLRPDTESRRPQASVPEGGLYPSPISPTVLNAWALQNRTT